MEISRLDHLVLTVRSIEASCEFYGRVLGMEVVSFAGNRRALQFGRQKLNLHQLGHEFEPKAARPTPGAADLCFITTTPLGRVIEHIKVCGIELIAGPVPRIGAVGPIESIYVRDPDGNLIEIANYLAQ